MRGKTAGFRVALALIAVTLASAGCSDTPDNAATTGPDGSLVVGGVPIANAQLWNAAQEEGTLTVYTSISEDRENALLDVFREQTGLDVEVVRLNGSQLHERILTERGAGELRADVIHQAEFENARALREQGVWEPYCPPGLENTADPRLRQPDCSFFISQTPVYAIGYNTVEVPQAEAPRSWQDLLDPRWRGKLGLTQIGAGGSTWTRDLFLRKKYGVEYWRSLAAQEPLITGGSAAVTDHMARGEVIVGMVLPGNQGLAAAEGSPVELVIPSDGVPAYLDQAGLAKGARHPNAAKVFLNWLISMPGQTAIAQQTSDYPVINGAPGPNFNGRELPTREEVDLQYMAFDPEYTSMRTDYTNGWYALFGYTPG